jgi:hypothetical protein
VRAAITLAPTMPPKVQFFAVRAAPEADAVQSGTCAQ